MAISNREREIISRAEKLFNDKSNALGVDGYFFEEPFVRELVIPATDLMKATPDAYNGNLGLVTPNYDDFPTEGAVGTRRSLVRLHSYLPSGGNSNLTQTFIPISSDPASNSIDDVLDVRLTNLIGPRFSPGKTNAADTDTSTRGFELALFPARDNVGTLEADTTNGPIPPTADPGADSTKPGAGNEGFWYVDYDAGLVRFSRPPLNGANGIMNPNNVFGDLNGNTVAAGAANATITMFATFYQYTGEFGIPDNLSFVTVGDGYVSTGIFTGNTANIVQAAVDSLPTQGGKIFVKEGNYDFNTSVTVPQSVSLGGLGQVNIDAPVSDPAFIINGGNVDIDNFIISSPNSTEPLIEIRSLLDNHTIDDIRIRENVLFCKSDAYGVNIAPIDQTVNYKNIRIEDNVFRAEQQEPGVAWVAGADDTNVITDSDAEFATSNESASVWTEVSQTIGLGNIDITSVAHDGFNLWTAVGGDITSGNVVIHTSNDGITWSGNRVSGIGGSLLDVAHDGKDRWVTVGQIGRIGTSANGIDWTFSPVESITLQGVDHDGNGLWVAVGFSGATTTEIRLSKDGTLWADVGANITDEPLRAVAHNKIDRWVAGSRNSKSLFTSLDGYAWTKVHDDATALASITGIKYDGRGLWVATADGGTGADILTSVDGVNWVEQGRITPANANQGLTSVDHNGIDKWIVGGTGVIFSSTDGLGWLKVHSDSRQIDGLSDKRFAVAHKPFRPVYVGEGSVDGYGSIENLSIRNNFFESTGINDARILLDGFAIESIDNLEVSGNTGGTSLNISKTISKSHISDNHLHTIEMSDASAASVTGDPTIADGSFEEIIMSDNAMNSLVLSTNTTLNNLQFDNNSVVSKSIIDGYVTNSIISDSRFGGQVRFERPLTNVKISDNLFDGYGVSLTLPAWTTDTTIQDNNIVGALVDLNLLHVGSGEGASAGGTSFFRLDKPADDGYGRHTRLNIVGNIISEYAALPVIGGDPSSGPRTSGIGPIVESRISDNILTAFTISNTAFESAVLNSTISNNSFAPNKTIPRELPPFLLRSPALLIIDVSGAVNDAAVMTSTIVGNSGPNTTSGVLPDFTLASISIRVQNKSALQSSTISGNSDVSLNITNNSIGITRATIERSSITGNNLFTMLVDNAGGTSAPCILNSIISSNHVTAGDVVIAESLGGAVSGGLALDNVVISNNQFENSFLVGAGAAEVDPRLPSVATTENSVISNNTFNAVEITGQTSTSAIEGNVFENTAIFGTINTSTFNGNIAQALTIGGATLVSGTAAISSSTMTGNRFSGAVSVSSAAVGFDTIEQSTISSNVFVSSLDIDYTANNAVAVLDRVIISSNRMLGAVTIGAGVTSADTSVSLIVDSIIASNIISSAFTAGDASLTVSLFKYTDAIISNNNIFSLVLRGGHVNTIIADNNLDSVLNIDGNMLRSTMSGNAISGTVNIDGDTAVLLDCVVSNNVFFGVTTAIQVAASTGSAMANTVFTGNSSLNDVVFVGSGTTQGPVTGSTISNNTISLGDLTITSDSVTSGNIILDSVVSNNTLQTGGIAIAGTATATGDIARNSVISNNQMAGKLDIAVNLTTGTGQAAERCVIDGNACDGGIQFGSVSRTTTLTTVTLSNICNNTSMLVSFRIFGVVTFGIITGNLFGSVGNTITRLEDSTLSNNQLSPFTIPNGILDTVMSGNTTGTYSMGPVVDSVISSNKFGGFLITTAVAGEVALDGSVISGNNTGLLNFTVQNTAVSATSSFVALDSVISDNFVGGVMNFNSAGTASQTILSSMLIIGNRVINDMDITHDGTLGQAMVNTAIIGNRIQSTLDIDAVNNTITSVLDSNISSNWCGAISIINTGASGGGTGIMINSSVFSGNSTDSGAFTIQVGQATRALQSTCITGNKISSTLSIVNNGVGTGTAQSVIANSSITGNHLQQVSIRQAEAAPVVEESTITGNSVNSNFLIDHSALGGVVLDQVTIGCNRIAGVTTIGSTTLVSTISSASFVGNSTANVDFNGTANTQYAGWVVVGNNGVTGSDLQTNQASTVPTHWLAVGNNYNSYTGITFSGTAPSWTTLNP
jgi:hypothetical protein